MLYGPKFGGYFPLPSILLLLKPLSFSTYCLQSEKEECTPFNQHERPESKNKKFFVFKVQKLEPIIQSEVSQKEKHQYSISTHIYGI